MRTIWNKHSNNAGRRGLPGSTGPAFALLATVQVSLIFTIGVISVPLPAIQADLSLSGQELAMVNMAFGLSFAGLLLLGGRLVDLVGRRRMLCGGAAIFGLASAVAAASPTYTVLVAARFAEGVGAALAAPAAMALLGDVYPDPARRTRATALWGGLSSAGATGGVLLGGVVAAVASWRWGLVAPAAVSALAVALAPRLLPPGPPPTKARLDVPGAVTATGAVTAVTFGLTASLDHPAGSPAVLVPLLGGLALLAGFWFRETRTPQPLLPPALLASARRAVALAAVMLTTAGIAGSGYLFALYFQQVRGWSLLQTSAAYLPLLLILPVAAGASRLVAHVGSRVVAAAGLVVLATGLALYGRLDVDTPYVGALLAGMLLLPVGAGLTFAAATVAAVDDTPPDLAGITAGALNTAMEIGPPLGVALLLAAADAHTGGLDHELPPAAATSAGYGFAFTMAAGVALLVGLAVMAIDPRRPHQPDPDEKEAEHPCTA